MKKAFASDLLNTYINNHDKLENTLNLDRTSNPLLGIDRLPS
ncbi:hypothetical protein [Metabacillus litoralis]|nr:hypothetical protein [Metabacillus litoralis]